MDMQTVLLAGILGSQFDQMKLQNQQLHLLQRQRDLQIMSSKYPAVNQVTLEQWLDRYYSWKFGPKKSKLQGVGFRLGVPVLATGAMLIYTIFALFLTVTPVNIPKSFDGIVTWTFWAAVLSLIICNVIGMIKAHQRKANWPSKPVETPEVY